MRKTAVHVPVGNMNYAVTAMNRYGLESTASQLLVNAGPAYSGPVIAITDGRPVRIPRSSVLDANYIIIEDMTGREVSIRPYGPTVSINGIPDGMYQMRTLGWKGRNYRIGFFCVKRKR